MERERERGEEKKEKEKKEPVCWFVGLEKVCVQIGQITNTSFSQTLIQSHDLDSTPDSWPLTFTPDSWPLTLTPDSWLLTLT